MPSTDDAGSTPFNQVPHGDNIFTDGQHPALSADFAPFNQLPNGDHIFTDEDDPPSVLTNGIETKFIEMLEQVTPLTALLQPSEGPINS